jgi:urea transport system ATP-binding protein
VVRGARLRGVLLRLNQEAGVTILLVEQKLPFARPVATRFDIVEKDGWSPVGTSAT